jgi:hypothetical protein
MHSLSSTKRRPLLFAYAIISPSWLTVDLIVPMLIMDVSCSALKESAAVCCKLMRKWDSGIHKSLPLR